MRNLYKTVETGCSGNNEAERKEAFAAFELHTLILSRNRNERGFRCCM